MFTYSIDNENSNKSEYVAQIIVAILNSLDI